MDENDGSPLIAELRRVGLYEPDADGAAERLALLTRSEIEAFEVQPTDTPWA